MAVIVETTRPKRLLRLFYQAIDDKVINTWDYDGNGHFHYRAAQWGKEALFHPAIGNGELRFLLRRKSKGIKPWKYVYGVFHGRLIEQFPIHFPDEFTLAAATAKPVR